MQVKNIDENLIKSFLPERPDNFNKGNCGKLVSIVGSKTMNGAAIMSTLSALRTGVGLTTVLTPEYTARIISPVIPEAMCVPFSENQDGAISINNYPEIKKYIEKATTVLIGCGISVCDSTKHIVENILNDTDCNIVIDADGINCLVENKELLHKTKANVIITPHIGEMARLVSKSIDYVVENQLDVAKEFSQKYNVTVALKSNTTIIAAKNGEVFENTTGNSALAKGGSGDVLAGMIASFSAQGISPEKACCIGCYLLGKSAEKITETYSKYSVIARDIINEIPKVLKSIGR